MGATWPLLRVMRSVDREWRMGKALASGACRVESLARRSGGRAKKQTHRRFEIREEADTRKGKVA